MKNVCEKSRGSELRAYGLLYKNDGRALRHQARVPLENHVYLYVTYTMQILDP
jgi:hypothetical protein